MTVHVHRSIGSVAAGGTTISQAESLADPELAKLATDRTWAFNAPPFVEERVINDVEFTGRSVPSVPKTPDETAEEATLQRSAAKEVNLMAQALRQIVDERVSVGTE